jgi:hypothetical protein
MFGVGRTREQGAQHPRAFAGRSLPGDVRQRRERLVYVSNAQRRFAGRRGIRRRRDRRVPDADPALPRRARQERHGGLDFARFEPCQQIGKPVDLVQPAADARDIGGRRHQLYKAHW